MIFIMGKKITVRTGRDKFVFRTIDLSEYITNEEASEEYLKKSDITGA